MKIQSLAVMFIILILPISVVLSTYTQNRVQTLSLQSQYDSKLKNATYDALKAYQINSFNSNTSSLTNSRIRDIKASVNTFFNSLSTNFSTVGYTKETLQNYVPAVVYTMYDGYYIYSPYTNTWDEETKEVNQYQTDLYKQTDPNYETSFEDGEKLYGLKPYVYYSCRYKGSNGMGNYDVVITYSLDNYISIQGTVANGKPVSKYGYLLSDVTLDGTTATYKGVTITGENALSEDVCVDGVLNNYKYNKVNGIKYYNRNGQIFSNISGKSIIQSDSSVYSDTDTSAVKYYAESLEMKGFIQTYLSGISTSNALDVDGKSYNNSDNQSPYTSVGKIFDFDHKDGIEAEDSNFNQHRMDVIKYAITRNLSVAISNYNNYSSASTDFQMPELKETDWEKIMDNISIISFLQGMSIGGKVYNGYSIITNTKNEDVVTENSIYIKTSDNVLHDVAENGLAIDSNTVGVLNVNAERKTGEVTDNGVQKTIYYFPLGGNSTNPLTLSYNSIVTRNDLGDKKSILKSNKELAKIYYTALGRERYSMYREKLNIDLENSSSSNGYKQVQVYFDANGGKVSNSSREIFSNSMYGTLPIPTRAGYQFDGWTTERDGSNYVKASTMCYMDTNHTLYAHWTPKPTYTISYDANGGSGAPQEDTKIEGIDFKLSDITPTKEGSVFLGWSTSTSSSIIMYQPGDIYRADNNVTLYAVWQLLTYTISYDANGGSGAPSSQTKNHGTDLQLSSTTPTRNGYEFLGWSEDSTATSAKYAAGATFSANSDTTLYAIWKTHEHDYERIVTKAATCTDVGIMTYKCKTCDSSYTEEIAKSGHNFSAQGNLRSSATCTSAATYWYKCSMCGEQGSTYFSSGEALGHDYVAQQVGIAPQLDNGGPQSPCTEHKNCVIVNWSIYFGCCRTWKNTTIHSSWGWVPAQVWESAHGGTTCTKYVCSRCGAN